MTPKGKNWKRVSVSMSEETLKFIDDEVEEGNYYNRSHAIQKLVSDEKKRRKMSSTLTTCHIHG